MNPPSEPRLEAVEILAVQQVLHRYADIVTRRAFAELPRVMESSCVLDLDLGQRLASFEGPTEIGEFIDRAVERFDFFQMVPLNVVAEIGKSGATAAARTHTVEIRQDAATGRRSDAFGVYQDQLRRHDDGTWLLASRRYQSLARTGAGEPGGTPDLEVLAVDYEDLATLAELR